MREIEYFYSAHSAYAYLGARRLGEVCADAGARLVHRPYLLSPVVEAVGSLPFASRSRAHVDYFFGRELERWSAIRKAPIVNHRPTHHDNPLELPNGFLIAADLSGADIDALSFAVLERHWRYDADIADEATLADIAKTCGVDPARLLDRALSEEVQAIHRANTQAATDRSVFGSPTYILNGDPFYGQDRLEMLEMALKGDIPAPAGFHNP